MEERVIFLTRFSQSLRNEVLDYYDKTHLYLKDLVSYKSINLRKETLTDSKEEIRATILKMLKAIKTGLNTIGVPIDSISNMQNIYLREIGEKTITLFNYNAFLDIYLRNYIDKVLFEILTEYLLDLDVNRFENLRLFKLISQSFIDKLDKFKKTHLNSKTKSFLTFPDIEEYLNFSDLSINIKSFNLNPKKTSLGIMKNERKNNKLTGKINGELTILEELHKAKKNSIESLKTSKRDLLISPQTKIENLTVGEKSTIFKENINQSPPTFSQSNLSVLPPVSSSFSLEKPKVYFLDYFGNLPSVHPIFLNKFKINYTNLLNSRVVNPDFIDLENLFYFISILKMSKQEFPFSPIELLDFLRNFITDKVFSFSKYTTPDPINIFYGLSIVSELNLLHKTNIIDLNATEEFLKTQLKEFLPEKLKINCYTMLGIGLLEKSEILTPYIENFLNQILGLDILNMEVSNPKLDIYYQLALIKTLDKNRDLSGISILYVNEIKKGLTSKGSISDSITQSALNLLILELLDLKEQESVLCSRLLNSIIKSSEFFKLKNIDKDFNWRIDKMAYKVELRMLFWALLSCTQYSPDNFLNF
ncbi:MAG: hypothetical protein ACFFA0_02400 [Promethearchaeota archaeon]